VFVLKELSQGGPTRVLTNLLAVLDPLEYEITVQVFRSTGVSRPYLPDHVDVQLIEPRGLFGPGGEAGATRMMWFLVRAAVRLLGWLVRHVFPSCGDAGWLLAERFVRTSTVDWDMAMSLIEGRSNYYVATKLRAAVKVGRVPTDYSVLDGSRRLDGRYFPRLDYVVTNSLVTLRILKDTFPSLAERFLFVGALTPPRLIRSMAERGEGFGDDFAGPRILTLSRLDDTKGTDLAIAACKLLFDRGLGVRWYVMGAGPTERYQAMVDALGLTPHFFFLKPRSNPFSFVRKCDIYVQPSRYEGRSNAVQEARVLGKPIVITNFATAAEHVTHMSDGIVADMNASSLAEALELLIRDEKLRCRIAREPDATAFDAELEKILALIPSNRRAVNTVPDPAFV